MIVVVRILGLTALWIMALLPPACACQGGGDASSSKPSQLSAEENKSNPQELKQQARIVVETNAPPRATETNATPPKAKSLSWKFAWEGWNGLHMEVSQKTAIKAPTAEWLTRIWNTNAQQTFSLEELKMSGRIGGRLAVDGAAYVTGKEFQGFDAGVEVRRARVYAEGDCLLVLPVSYRLEVGYIPNQFYMEESYLAFENLRYFGELKLGQYQAPMGLDVITSSRDITFMEPAAPMQALAPGVNAGVQLGQPFFDRRATWTVGAFTEGVGKEFGDASKDFGRVITRMSGLPIYNPNADQPGAASLLHLGLSANILYSGDSVVRYQSRPESHLAPYVVDTGDITAQGALVLATEAAWVNGPFSVQGEYLQSFVDQSEGQVLSFPGFYAAASWFLTGETRPYNRTEGKFARVIPKHNFNWGDGGWGAWEIAGRFSLVDLDSGDIHGGRLSMLMAGLNWYLHSHVKWRFDYGFGHVSGRSPEGNLNIFETRVEVDF